MSNDYHVPDLLVDPKFLNSLDCWVEGMLQATESVEELKQNKILNLIFDLSTEIYCLQNSCKKSDIRNLLSLEELYLETH